MLSKLIIVIIGSMIHPVIATAHPHNQRNPQTTVNVTIGWTWIGPTVFRTGHWNHPNYGRSYRTIHVGPPPPRPRANAIWIPGHWERRQGKRIWVQGHWRH